MARLEAVPPERIAAVLVKEIFDVAAAIPVRSAEDAADHDTEVDPVRGVPVSQMAVASTIETPRHREGQTSSRGTLGSFVSGLLERGPTAAIRTAFVRSEVMNWWRSLTTRRRRMLVAGGCAGLAVAIAVIVVPVPSPATPDAREGRIVAQPDASQQRTPSAKPTADAAINGDDPLAALEVLLDRRDECYRTRSILCVDGFDQPGSSASEGDGRAVAASDGDREIDAALPGPAAEFDLESALIAERLGDSALIEVTVDTRPASLLLMRSEAGWRIRDYLMPMAEATEGEG
ncbi:MAG TPA: hypothetical protein VNT53_10020 [Pseudolysinimonas sp.]|nr:hypothetical protein [Pseudolysinimonas sp.]